MTQKEFQDRVKMQVSAGEYTAIEVVYMNSDLEKDEFCKMWAKMNAKRIAAYRKAEKENKRNTSAYRFSLPQGSCLESLPIAMVGMQARNRYLLQRLSRLLTKQIFTSRSTTM